MRIDDCRILGLFFSTIDNHKSTILKDFGHKFEEWVQVLRFDSAHGYPHMDKLNKYGNKIEIIKFDYLTNKEALTISIDLIKNNFKEFVNSFLQNDGD